MGQPQWSCVVLPDQYHGPDFPPWSKDQRHFVIVIVAAHAGNLRCVRASRIHAGLSLLDAPPWWRLGVGSPMVLL